MNNIRYPRAWIAIAVVAVIGVGLAVGAGLLVPGDWLSRLKYEAVAAPASEHPEDDHDHAGHSHGMKSHPGHDELNALGISTQAEQTIGLKVCRIKLEAV